VKRLPILVKMFLLLVCFSFVLSAYNSGSQVNNNLIVPYVEFEPIIDGEMDEDWTFNPVGMFVYEVAAGAGAAASQKINHSAWFKTAYNADGFYFFANVTDDSIYMDSTANDYEQDCFEIYFDGDNSKGSSYDGVDDVQWRWVYGNTGAGTPGSSQPECPNAEGAWLETDDGYTFELMIPAEDLTFTPEAGAVIGFEVQCADNDTGARDGIIKWWNQNGNSWKEPQLFGTAELGVDSALQDEVVGDFVAQLEFAPTINGIEEEWQEVPEIKLTVNENWQMTDGGYKDFNPYYRAAWNADGFYFFGRVLDDIIYVDTAGEDYNQDCFELYFDGDNSKGASYDGIDDVQWRWVYGNTGAGKPGGGQPECPNAEAAWVENADGYQFELAIPASDLTFTPEEGAVIGFEVHCADNDTGAREVIAKWWNINGNSWQEPQLFGTVELNEEIAGKPEQLPSDITLSIPSVINASTNITYALPERSHVELNLFNIAGQKVLTIVDEKKMRGTNIQPLDISNLANGVYLCRLEACDNIVIKKITLIK
jgi:hypothetical protein